jgi:hypothetical protein
MSVQFYKSGVGYYVPGSSKKIFKEVRMPLHINNLKRVGGKISTIRDEERIRILALREQAKEDVERIKKNLEDHKRLLKIRKSEKTKTRNLDLDSILNEIRRPPPVPNIREQNIRDITNTSLSNINSKQKELYEKNIESVKEMSQYKPKDPCSVCYDDDPESMLIMVCCKQYFCFACISAWWKEKKTCPSCRLDDPVFVEVVNKKERKNLCGLN